MSSIPGAIFAVLAAANAGAQAAADHVRAELVSETSALVPGRRAWLGLHLVHDPHWHTYWINPGDSGLPTKLEWQLPANLRAGAIAWPVPRRFEVGGLFNFGYDGDVLLPVPLDVAADARPGMAAPIAVEAKWLVCREECIPGKARLTLTLPVETNNAADPRWRQAFAAARARLPLAGAWHGGARLQDDRIELTLSGDGLPAGDDVDAFVVQPQVVAYAPPRLVRHSGALTLSFGKSEYFSAAPAALDVVLVAGGDGAGRAHVVSAPFASGPTANP